MDRQGGHPLAVLGVAGNASLHDAPATYGLPQHDPMVCALHLSHTAAASDRTYVLNNPFLFMFRAIDFLESKPSEFYTVTKRVLQMSFYPAPDATPQLLQIGVSLINTFLFMI